MGDATPAADVGAMLLMEMALHGWDVARATGQEFNADDATAAALEDIVQAQAELFRKYQGFADAIEPPRNATAFERALTLSGRDPELEASVITTRSAPAPARPWRTPRCPRPRRRRRPGRSPR